MALKLWGENLEALRSEAQRVVNTLPPPPKGEDLPVDPVELVAVMNEGLPPHGAASEMAAEVSIPGPAGEIPARLFVPDSPRAMYLHTHGGGWCLGSAIRRDSDNERLAKAHNLIVLSVDYRLAPKHPYPAGPDDCEAAAQWLLINGLREYGTKHLFVGGESSGAHLAIITALRCLAQPDVGDGLVGVNLLSGFYDLNGTPSQRSEWRSNDAMAPEVMRRLTEAFTPGMTEEQRRSPDVSPLYADLRGLPSCLVSGGALDHLLDDSLFLAQRLAAAEVEVDLVVYPDSPHGFEYLPSPMTGAYETRLDDWIEAILSRI